MRDTYRNLFGRIITALAVSAAPTLLTTVFPGVSPLMALLFGGGSLGALLSDPVKDVAATWLERVGLGGRLTAAPGGWCG